jgi:hypothetical protein
MIIGLSGYARSGKDTAAEVLVERYGFTQIAFADKLRDVLYELNPMIATEWVTFGGGSSRIHAETIFLQDVIDNYGWGEYKNTVYGPEIRRLLQRLGTEAGRQTLWDSIWIDAAFSAVEGAENIVVTDCRFPNEAQAIKDRGGEVWRISRRGIGPANDHPSETSLDDWLFDTKIYNDAKLKTFKNQIGKHYENRR